MTTNNALDLSVLSEENEKELDVKPSTAEVPGEVKAFVDRAHTAWQERPKKWREITLPTEEAVADVVKLAKKFARATDRTFRQRTHDGPATTLQYKVTDKVVKNGSTPDSEGGDNAESTA